MADPVDTGTSGFAFTPEIAKYLEEDHRVIVIERGENDLWASNSETPGYSYLYMRSSWEMIKDAFAYPAHPVEKLDHHYLIKLVKEDESYGLYYSYKTSRYQIENENLNLGRERTVTSGSFMVDILGEFCKLTGLPDAQVFAMYQYKAPPTAKPDESLLTQQQKRCEQYKDTGFGRWS